jgi:hypothetical protein
MQNGEAKEKASRQPEEKRFPSKGERCIFIFFPTITTESNG